MTDVPDKSLFSVNERPREYEATFNVRGTISVTLHADSLEEAKSAAKALLDDEEFGCEIDQVDSVDLNYVFKTPPMFRVTRAGKPLQVSMLKAGDIPRDPDDRGF